MALSARQREHGLLPSHLGPVSLALPRHVLGALSYYIPWISSSDSGRRLCIRACEHHLNVSDRTMVLIVGQPWCMCGGVEGDKSEKGGGIEYLKRDRSMKWMNDSDENLCGA